MDDDERKQWVNNDEGLYRWWERSGLPLGRFVRNNRAELDEVIADTLRYPKTGARVPQSMYLSRAER